MTMRDEFSNKPDCSVFVRLGLDRFYGELSPEDGEALSRHLDGCPNCRTASGSWERIGRLLSSFDPAELAPTPSLAPERGLRADRIGAVSLILGFLTAGLSALPWVLTGDWARIGAIPMATAVLLWGIAYQSLFAGLLADHLEGRLPLAIDIRTVLLGLFACEGLLVVLAGACLGGPLFESRMAAAVRLSLPGLLTSLSCSILLAMAAVLAIRGKGRPGVDAAAIAILHGLLLLPSLALIQPLPQSLSATGSTLAGMIACMALGSVLGGVANRLASARGGSPWSPEVLRPAH